MVRLSESWFAEPLFDYEYKSYQLLAYTHSISNRFEERKFFPYLPDIVRHIDHINRFRLVKDQFENALRRDVIDIDPFTHNLVREAIPDESGLLDELESILQFAERELNTAYTLGTEQLSDTQNEVLISPVGLLLTHVREGFLFFRKPETTRIYSYSVRTIHRPVQDETYKDVVTKFLMEIRTGMFTNYGEVKWKLLKSGGAACNAYLVESNVEVPQYETLLPLAKIHIMKQA